MFIPFQGRAGVTVGRCVLERVPFLIQSASVDRNHFYQNKSFENFSRQSTLTYWRSEWFAWRVVHDCHFDRSLDCGNIDVADRWKIRSDARWRSTGDKRMEHVRNILERTNNADNASRIRYSLALYQSNHWEEGENLQRSERNCETYAKTAISRFNRRILMNNMWKARRTCVAVASASLRPVPLLLICARWWSDSVASKRLIEWYYHRVVLYQRLRHRWTNRVHRRFHWIFLDQWRELDCRESLPERQHRTPISQWRSCRQRQIDLEAEMRCMASI